MFESNACFFCFLLSVYIEGGFVSVVSVVTIVALVTLVAVVTLVAIVALVAVLL